MKFRNSIITGSGSYIPETIVSNAAFAENPFCSDRGQLIDQSNTEIIEKFEKITGIAERRYVHEEQSASDIAAIAGDKAIRDAGLDLETLDMIIVAHNFGDVVPGSMQTDIIPSLASRVKHLLGVKNPSCVAYDLIFGCPGWLQGLIQAHVFIQAKHAQSCLVIGTETLSKMVDPFDRDTMIFADGAGAVVLEGRLEDEHRGILSTANQSHCDEEVDYLTLGSSYNAYNYDEKRYIKMQGRKIYEYALSHVPPALKQCLTDAGVNLRDIHKILLHQANEKMDQAIVKRLFRLYGQREIPADILPMTIERLGNSSVATVPTLWDMIRHGELGEHRIQAGDLVILASVGAGMNINAVTYKA